MRMSLADIDDLLATANEPGPPPPEPTDTLCYVLEEKTIVPTNCRHYAMMGPFRSFASACTAMFGRYPFTREVIQGQEGLDFTRRFTHLRWTDEDGNEVLVELVEEHNPAVYASPAGTTLYVVNRQQPHGCLIIVGTYLALDEANAAARELLEDDCSERGLQPGAPIGMPDGTMCFCGRTAGGEIWVNAVSKFSMRG